MASLRIPIEDLGCAASDAPVLERCLARTPGVVAVYVNPVTDIACVEFDTGQTDPWRLTLAVAAAGYRAGPVAGPTDERP